MIQSIETASDAIALPKGVPEDFGIPVQLLDAYNEGKFKIDDLVQNVASRMHVLAEKDCDTIHDIVDRARNISSSARSLVMNHLGITE